MKIISLNCVHISANNSLSFISAKTYSLNHKQMYKPSAQCGNDNFKNGITNGNKWYKVYNGMQDWNYFYNDCFEVTIELGCCKYPTGSSNTSCQNSMIIDY